MKNDLLKQALIIGMMLLFVGSFVASAMSSTLITKKETNETSEPLNIKVQTDGDIIEINYQINTFTKIPVIINDMEYLRILLGDESNMLSKGMPDLPDVRRSVLIPDTAKMDARVISSTFKEFKNILIAPSKGDLPRTINPEYVPYVFDEMYDENKWFPENIVELEMPYILRDFRGQIVKINPFQYNPVEKTLRFYTEITVEIYSTETDTINCITRTELPSKIDTDFKQIYSRHFLNFNTMGGRYDTVGEQGNMLIVTYDDFWDEMVPFVEWKIMKGVPTEMVKVSEIGNANAIRTYIADYYNNNGLTFVLLVGDAAQVPSLYTSSYTYGASDPSYSYIVGNDNYQDLFVGRFSAQNTDDLFTQVERSIEYEKYPQVGNDWYHKGMGVASNQGPGDDGEYDDEHMDNIRDDLLGYTYTEVDQIYDPYATSSMVSTALNDGRGIANYCGHGSPTSWGSSGFSNGNVNQLTNDNMLPFICSVACNNGEFDSYDACFAEAWLRATNNGEPTGAIGFFASTQSQSWDPPMDAEDEIIDILIETYVDNIRTTYGALCFEGTMHMMDEYGSSCYDETDSWTVFGDPSLQVRTDTPSSMTVAHEPQVGGGTSFEVIVTGVENALCAISRGTDLFGYAYTDASGHAVIQFDEPIPGLDPVNFVVTAYNKEPYITTLQLNGPPAIPDRPSGPSSGKPGVEYLFTTSTIDPDGDDVFYMWRWGDGNYSDWLGPFDSGATASATHIWSEEGNYQVRVKAKDIHGVETDWSESLPISMPLNQPSFNILLAVIEQIQNEVRFSD